MLFLFFLCILRVLKNSINENSITLPVASTIFSQLSTAKTFKIALQKMVKPAIKELTRQVARKYTPASLMRMASTKLTPPAPLKIPQMSPTTSPQKEETFSRFWQSFFAVTKPLEDVCFSRFSRDVLVTATPIMSNMDAKTMKKMMTKSERNTGNVGNKLCDTTLKKMDKKIERTKVRTAQFRFRIFISYYIFENKKIGQEVLP